MKFPLSTTSTKIKSEEKLDRTIYLSPELYSPQEKLKMQRAAHAILTRMGVLEPNRQYFDDETAYDNITYKQAIDAFIADRDKEEILGPLKHRDLNIELDGATLYTFWQTDYLAYTNPHCFSYPGYKDTNPLIEAQQNLKAIFLAAESCPTQLYVDYLNTEFSQGGADRKNIFMDIYSGAAPQTVYFRLFRPQAAKKGGHEKYSDLGIINEEIFKTLMFEETFMEVIELYTESVYPLIPAHITEEAKYRQARPKHSNIQALNSYA
jgi:hypothetical protein